MSSLKLDSKAIFMIFIGAIITVVFLGSIADQIVSTTTTQSITNETVTAPAAANGTLDLTGRTLISEIEIYNATNVGQRAVNLTIRTNISSGLETVQLFANASSDFLGEDVNVSYSFQPDGYIQESSTRSITLLITIIGALAIVVFVVIVFLKQGSVSKLVNLKNLRK